MSRELTGKLARELLSRLAAGDAPGDIALLFSPRLEWNVLGDRTAFPWIWRKTGQGALADFVHATRTLLRLLRFKVHEVLTSDDRAVILGALASEVKHTGATIETQLAIALTVAGGQITGFLMLEDSFAVSQAAPVT